MNEEKILNQIKDNYKSYQWHKKVDQTSDYFFNGVFAGKKFEWRTYYEAQVGDGEYADAINERYFTGNIYVVVGEKNVKINYYPKNSFFYGKELGPSLELYNFIKEYLPEQERVNKEKEEQEKIIREQQYEEDIARVFGLDVSETSTLEKQYSVTKNGNCYSVEVGDYNGQ